MWKRHASRDRQLSIGTPTLVGTDVDPEVLHNSTNINNANYSLSSRPAFGRKGTKDVLKGLPALPFDSLQIPQGVQPRPVSDVPTLSSVYSQAPHENNTSESKTLQLDDTRSRDVSPPSTPGLKESTAKVSPEISPVSGTPSPTGLQSPTTATNGSRKYNSSLPIPKNNLKKFWKLPTTSKDSPDPESSAVRWDEYSGEPTESERGKPPSATPGSVKMHEAPLVGKVSPTYGVSTYISANPAPPIRKRSGVKDVSIAQLPIRPGWRGPGGRHSIVDPVYDKTASQKEHTPDENGQYYHSAIMNNEPSSMPQLTVETKNLPDSHGGGEGLEDHRGATQRAYERSQHQERDKERDRQQRLHRERIAQAKRGRERLHEDHDHDRSPRQRVPPPVIPEPLRLQAEKLPAPIAIAPLRTKNNPAIGTQSHLAPESEVDAVAALQPIGSSETVHNHHEDPDTKTPSNDAPRSIHGQTQPHTYDVPDQAPSNDSESQDAQRKGLYEHPASRFSATTVATSAYDHSESPPPTPLQLNSSSPDGIPNSILNRKRPVLSNEPSIKRKPTPTQIITCNPGGTTNGVTFKESKNLPKPPPDAPVEDPVQMLQAKQDVLRRRRRNLETVIHELTSVVQPSSIAYDRASRAEIKKTVAGLQKEMAEVIKDEHETGLKLHRAWKRHDDIASYEPTSIWVRRVTS